MQPLRWPTSSSSPILAEFGQYREGLGSPGASKQAAMRAQVSFAARPAPEPELAPLHNTYCISLQIGIMHLKNNKAAGPYSLRAELFNTELFNW